VTGLDLLRYFVFQERNFDMGRLLPTDFETSGHKFDFQYLQSNQLNICLMSCACGWDTNIDTFQHSWSVIEVKVKVQKHLADCGLTSYHPAAIFDFAAE
jgi:hypothetical protein